MKTRDIEMVYWILKNSGALGSGRKKVTTPKINPNSKTFTESFEATITCATEGAEILYRLIKQDTSSQWEVYKNHIKIDFDYSVKLEAKATKDDMDESNIAVVEYIYKKEPQEKIAKPTISVNGGNFDNDIEVTVSSATEGVSLYINTRDKAWKEPDSVFSLTNKKTIKKLPTDINPIKSPRFNLYAIATKGDPNNVDESSEVFVSNEFYFKCAKPEVIFEKDYDNDLIRATIKPVVTENAKYEYQIDNNTAIEINDINVPLEIKLTENIGKTIKIYTTKTYFDDSDKIEYLVEQPPMQKVATPTLEPDGGTFNNDVDIIVKTTTDGAKILLDWTSDVNWDDLNNVTVSDNNIFTSQGIPSGANLISTLYDPESTSVDSGENRSVLKIKAGKKANWIDSDVFYSNKFIFKCAKPKVTFGKNLTEDKITIDIGEKETLNSKVYYKIKEDPNGQETEILNNQATLKFKENKDKTIQVYCKKERYLNSDPVEFLIEIEKVATPKLTPESSLNEINNIQLNASTETEGANILVSYDNTWDETTTFSLDSNNYTEKFPVSTDKFKPSLNTFYADTIYLKATKLNLEESEVYKSGGFFFKVDTPKVNVIRNDAEDKITFNVETLVTKDAKVEFYKYDNLELDEGRVKITENVQTLELKLSEVKGKSIRIYATKKNYYESDIFNYFVDEDGTKEKVATPTMSIERGMYYTEPTNKIDLYCTTEDVVIYYRYCYGGTFGENITKTPWMTFVNGSELHIDDTNMHIITLEFKAIKEGMNDSSMIQVPFVYGGKVNKNPIPYIEPFSQPFSSSFDVKISSNLNYSEKPELQYKLYEVSTQEPEEWQKRAGSNFTLNISADDKKSYVLKVKDTSDVDKENNPSVASESLVSIFTYEEEAVKTPVITPNGGNFKNDINLSISTNTEGASLIFNWSNSDLTDGTRGYVKNNSVAYSNFPTNVDVMDFLGISNLKGALSLRVKATKEGLKDSQIFETNPFYFKVDKPTVNVVYEKDTSSPNYGKLIVSATNGITKDSKIVYKYTDEENYKDYVEALFLDKDSIGRTLEFFSKKYLYNDSDSILFEINETTFEEYENGQNAYKYPVLSEDSDLYKTGNFQLKLSYEDLNEEAICQFKYFDEYIRDDLEFVGVFKEYEKDTNIDIVKSSLYYGAIETRILSKGIKPSSLIHRAKFGFIYNLDKTLPPPVFEPFAGETYSEDLYVDPVSILIGNKIPINFKVFKEGNEEDTWKTEVDLEDGLIKMPVFTEDTDVVIKAINTMSTREKIYQSTDVVGTYHFKYVPKIEAPVLDPNGGNFNNDITLNLSTNTDGAIIESTWSGNFVNPSKSTSNSLSVVDFPTQTVEGFNNNFVTPAVLAARATKNNFLDSDTIFSNPFLFKCDKPEVNFTIINEGGKRYVTFNINNGVTTGSEVFYSFIEENPLFKYKEIKPIVNNTLTLSEEENFNEGISFFTQKDNYIKSDEILFFLTREFFDDNVEENLYKPPVLSIDTNTLKTSDFVLKLSKENQDQVFFYKFVGDGNLYIGRQLAYNDDTGIKVGYYENVTGLVTCAHLGKGKNISFYNSIANFVFYTVDEPKKLPTPVFNPISGTGYSSSFIVDPISIFNKERKPCVEFKVYPEGTEEPNDWSTSLNNISKIDFPDGFNKDTKVLLKARNHIVDDGIDYYSDIEIAEYFYKVPKVKKPIITPDGGNYINNISITLATEEDGAKIKNGWSSQDPGIPIAETDSNTLTVPDFPVLNIPAGFAASQFLSPEVLVAFALKENMPNSDIVYSKPFFFKVDNPVVKLDFVKSDPFEESTCTFTATNGQTDGATLYYMFENIETQKGDKIEYKQPFTVKYSEYVNKGKNLRIFAEKEGYTRSDEYYYEINNGEFFENNINNKDKILSLPNINLDTKTCLEENSTLKLTYPTDGVLPDEFNKNGYFEYTFLDTLGRYYGETRDYIDEFGIPLGYYGKPVSIKVKSAVKNNVTEIYPSHSVIYNFGVYSETEKLAPPIFSEPYGKIYSSVETSKVKAITIADSLNNYLLQFKVYIDGTEEPTEWQTSSDLNQGFIVLPTNFTEETKVFVKARNRYFTDKIEYLSNEVIANYIFKPLLKLETPTISINGGNFINNINKITIKSTEGKSYSIEEKFGLQGKGGQKTLQSDSLRGFEGINIPTNTGNNSIWIDSINTERYSPARGANRLVLKAKSESDLIADSAEFVTDYFFFKVAEPVITIEKNDGQEAIINITTETEDADIYEVSTNTKILNNKYTFNKDSANRNVCFVAKKQNYNDSNLIYFYPFLENKCATPVASDNGYSYLKDTITVTLTCDTEGAKILYMPISNKIDIANENNENWFEYNGSITIDNSVDTSYNLYFKAIKEGLSDSDIKRITYWFPTDIPITKSPIPNVNPKSKEFSKTFNVSITIDNINIGWYDSLNHNLYYKLYKKTDQEPPIWTEGVTFSISIIEGSDWVLKVKSFKDPYQEDIREYSDILTFEYTYLQPKVEKIILNNAGGNFTDDINVTFNTNPAGSYVEISNNSSDKKYSSQGTSNSNFVLLKFPNTELFNDIAINLYNSFSAVGKLENFLDSDTLKTGNYFFKTNFDFTNSYVDTTDKTNAKLVLDAGTDKTENAVIFYTDLTKDAPVFEMYQNPVENFSYNNLSLNKFLKVDYIKEYYMYDSVIFYKTKQKDENTLSFGEKPLELIVDSFSLIKSETDTTFDVTNNVNNFDTLYYQINGTPFWKESDIDTVIKLGYFDDKYNVSYFFTNNQDRDNSFSYIVSRFYCFEKENFTKKRVFITLSHDSLDFTKAFSVLIYASNFKNDNNLHTIYYKLYKTTDTEPEEWRSDYTNTGIAIETENSWVLKAKATLNAENEELMDSYIVESTFNYTGTVKQKVADPVIETTGLYNVINPVDFKVSTATEGATVLEDRWGEFYDYSKDNEHVTILGQTYIDKVPNETLYFGAGIIKEKEQDYDININNNFVFGTNFKAIKNDFDDSNVIRQNKVYFKVDTPKIDIVRNDAEDKITFTFNGSNTEGAEAYLFTVDRIDDVFLEKKRKNITNNFQTKEFVLSEIKNSYVYISCKKDYFCDSDGLCYFVDEDGTKEKVATPKASIERGIAFDKTPLEVILTCDTDGATIEYRYLYPYRGTGSYKDNSLWFTYDKNNPLLVDVFNGSYILQVKAIKEGINESINLYIILYYEGQDYNLPTPFLTCTGEIDGYTFWGDFVLNFKSNRDGITNQVKIDYKIFNETEEEPSDFEELNTYTDNNGFVELLVSGKTENFILKFKEAIPSDDIFGSSRESSIVTLKFNYVAQKPSLQKVITPVISSEKQLFNITEHTSLKVSTDTKGSDIFMNNKNDFGYLSKYSILYTDNFNGYLPNEKINKDTITNLYFKARKEGYFDSDVVELKDIYFKVDTPKINIVRNETENKLTFSLTELTKPADAVTVLEVLNKNDNIFREDHIDIQPLYYTRPKDFSLNKLIGKYVYIQSSLGNFSDSDGLCYFIDEDGTKERVATPTMSIERGTILKTLPYEITLGCDTQDAKIEYRFLYPNLNSKFTLNSLWQTYSDNTKLIIDSIDERLLLQIRATKEGMSESINRYVLMLYEGENIKLPLPYVSGDGDIDGYIFWGSFNLNFNTNLTRGSHKICYKIFNETEQEPENWEEVEMSYGQLDYQLQVNRTSNFMLKFKTVNSSLESNVITLRYLYDENYIKQPTIVPFGGSFSEMPTLKVSTSSNSKLSCWPTLFGDTDLGSLFNTDQSEAEITKDFGIWEGIKFDKMQAKAILKSNEALTKTTESNVFFLKKERPEVYVEYLSGDNFKFTVTNSINLENVKYYISSKQYPSYDYNTETIQTYTQSFELNVQDNLNKTLYFYTEDPSGYFFNSDAIGFKLNEDFLKLKNANTYFSDLPETSASSEVFHTDKINTRILLSYKENASFEYRYLSEDRDYFEGEYKIYNNDEIPINNYSRNHGTIEIVTLEKSTREGDIKIPSPSLYKSFYFYNKKRTYVPPVFEPVSGTEYTKTSNKINPVSIFAKEESEYNLVKVQYKIYTEGGQEPADWQDLNPLESKTISLPTDATVDTKYIVKARNFFKIEREEFFSEEVTSEYLFKFTQQEEILTIEPASGEITEFPVVFTVKCDISNAKIHWRTDYTDWKLYEGPVTITEERERFTFEVSLSYIGEDGQHHGHQYIEDYTYVPKTK